MAKEFSPEDFEPIYHQTLVITIAIQENPECTLAMLLPFLDSIHTKLSTLIFKATNPNSLLQRRCSDRHGDWLQIQYDLQNTLCETQDLVDTLAKSDVLETGDQGVLGPAKMEEELALHDFNLGEFIDSLGISNLGRTDPALAEIEKTLVAAARDEREKLGREKVYAIPDTARLGGLGMIMSLLRTSVVDRSELHRLDTKIKQVIVWVLRNEEEITICRDLEGFGDLGKGQYLEHRPRQQEQPDEDHEEETLKSAEIPGPAKENQDEHEEEAQKMEDAEEHDFDPDDDYDNVSMDSFVLV
jgi:hypothetical protein